jgi:hypothetical protein
MKNLIATASDDLMREMHALLLERHPQLNIQGK